jgi:tetratricopeptide (TPR) repeat protein
LPRVPKLTIKQAFDHARQHHSAGKLRDAEQLYLQILEQEPRHADAIQLLGLIAHQRGDHANAVDLIQRAIALNPDAADYYNNLGTALRSNGQLDEAIAAYQMAITQKDGYAAAINNLGLALKDKGNLDAAIAAFQQVIALNPASIEVHNNLGRAFKENRQFEDAIAAYRQVIALNPDYAEAHSNLGNALRDIGQPGEAIAAYQRAIAIKPEFAEAQNNLGNALADKDRFEEAIAAYHRAIEINPAFAEAHSNLGNALRNVGKLDEAIASYRLAIEHRPGWTAPCLNLGHLFREMGQFEEAYSAFSQALRNKPGDPVALSCLAAALAELHRFDEATLALDRAAAIAPDSLLTHLTRGIIQLRNGRGAEAVESFRVLVERAPQFVSGWNNLAAALRQIGRFNEAAECVQRALALRPDSIRAHTLLAGLSGVGESSTENLIAIFRDPKTSLRDRASTGFASGKTLDQADRFDEAFGYYAEANSLTLQIRNASGARYDSDLFSRRVDETIALFTPVFFSRTRDWGEPSELPVFIVGMPRSGTSLVEQIAASHSAVFGAGELKDIDHLATGLTVAELRPDQIKQMARAQLDRLQKLVNTSAGSVARVIDKMPSNVELLGLIATLFPAARVIICRRDPRDTCLSCYFQSFSSGNLFSFDLWQCGRHHVHTDRLISHWLKVLPLRILEVQYEALVADLEVESRRIIAFLGLPWEEACLEFHRTERMVQTASDWQVRQPIYTRSVGRWRNYQRHLAPLFEALGIKQ